VIGAKFFLSFFLSCFILTSQVKDGALLLGGAPEQPGMEELGRVYMDGRHAPTPAHIMELDLNAWLPGVGAPAGPMTSTAACDRWAVLKKCEGE
jgi:hypothetical protein